MLYIILMVKIINYDINTNINNYDNVKIKYSYGNKRFG